MVKKGGSITSTQKGLELLESEKEKIISKNMEDQRVKQSTTCEHGQILMTINNLYMKVSKKENWQLVGPAKKKDEEYQPPLEQTQFETQDTEEITLKQLAAIEQFTNSYAMLVAKYKASKEQQKRAMQQQQQQVQQKA